MTVSANRPSVQDRLESATQTERSVWNALRTVEDPELPVSIVDLGLIYNVTVETGTVAIEMTLTYSGCPARDLIIEDVEEAVRMVSDIDAVDISLVYSPPWSYERITEQGRTDLREHGLAVPGDPKSPDPNCYDTGTTAGDTTAEQTR